MSILRPKTRGDCRNGPRPCPWAGCRHHLFLDVRPGGGIRRNSQLPPWRMQSTCSLDLADAEDGMSLEELAEYFGITRQAVQHIVDGALAKLRGHEAGLADNVVPEGERDSLLFARHVRWRGMSLRRQRDIYDFTEASSLTKEEKLWVKKALKNMPPVVNKRSVGLTSSST